MMTRVTVSGKSAAQLKGYVRLFARILLGIILVAGFFVAIDFGQRTPLLFIGAGLGVICGISAVVIGLFLAIANMKELDEVRNGYTTLQAAHQDVEERDPLTGRVVRTAGEPYLTPELRAARLAEPGNLTSIPEGSLSPGRARIHQSRGTRIAIAVSAVAGLITLVLRLTGFFSS